MIQYIYFVKCPNCEDEHFDFFDDAKGFALGCLSKKPIITQTEVCRNDFGECTDSSDLGTIWSWEDEMKDTEKETTDGPSLLTKDFLDKVDMDNDPEFADDDSDFRFINELDEGISNGVSFRNSEDFAEFKKLCDEIGIITMGDLNNFMKENDANDANILDKLREYRAELGPDFKIKEARKPVPEGMTIEQLVEEMEENEDDVECSLCNELTAKTDCYYDEDEGYICPECKENSVKCSWCGMYFDKDECRYEVDLGWLCDRCEAAIKSRGETLTFKENNYWDFLDEAAGPRDPFDHHDPDYDEDEAADHLAYLSDKAHDERYDDAIDSLDEGFDGSEKVDLEYDDLTVTLYGNQRDADDWDEVEHSGSYTYTLDKNEVATTIWENWITEEDVADVPGGLEALEDNDTWEQFLETHFDALFDKYYDKLLDYYEESAADEFRDNYSYDDHYDDLQSEADDAAYDAWRDEQWD